MTVRNPFRPQLNPKRHWGIIMIRSIVIGLGIAIILLGFQLFCFQEMVIKTDVEQALSVKDFMPYSLICCGLVIYFYGYQLQKS